MRKNPPDRWTRLRQVGLVIFGALLVVTSTGNKIGFGVLLSTLAVMGIIVIFVYPFRMKRLAIWLIKRNRLTLLLIVLATLITGDLFLKNPNMGGDSLQYHSAFHSLMAGTGWRIYDGSWARVDPGFGMLSYVFFLMFRDIELSGMLVNALAYLLMIPAVYFVVDFMFGKRTALLAAFLVTFYPTLISYSYLNLSDVVFTCLLIFGFSLYVRILLDRNTIRRSAALGLVLGIAYLTRAAEGLLVAGLVLVSLLILTIAKRKQHFFASVPSLFWAPGIAVFIFLVVASPYVVFIHSQTAVWTFTSQVLYSTAETQIVTIAADTQTVTSTTVTQQAQYLGVQANFSPRITNIVRNVSVLLVRLLMMNVHALVPLALLWAIFPFLATRKLFTQLYLSSRKLCLLLAFAVFSSPALIHLSISALHSNRWQLQYSVFILIAIAFFTVRFLERILESMGSRHFNVGVALICLLTLAASLGMGSPTLYEALTTPHAHLGLRAAGLWLHENVQDPANLDIIAPRKGAVALFYASGKNFSMGNSQNASMPLQEIGDLLNTGEVDYLLLDNHYVHSMPQLEALWNDPDLAQDVGLSLLYSDSSDLFQIYTGAASP
jgi:4-amino-4-deoxy-L-arabinose transferase-like glycosyltransferase